MLKQMHIKRFVIGGLAALCALVLVSAPVYAHDGEEHETTTKTATQTQQEKERSEKAKEELRKKLEAERKAAVEKRQDLKAAAKGRLDEAKKRVCEKRVVQIKRTVGQAAQQGEKHLAVFDTISDRVQQFYLDKKLNVTNYDALVKEVEAKRANVVALIAKTKDLKFECTDENATGKAEALKNTINALHAALKEYRTSIKNLIVAVKTAAVKVEQDPESGEEDEQ